MAIVYDKEKGLISLHSRNTSYQMGIGPYGHLLHYYYGKRGEGDFSYLFQYKDRGFSGNPYDANADRTYSMDTLAQEYSSFGNGDYRIPACSISGSDGEGILDLRVDRVEIFSGRSEPEGLPHAKAVEECETLRIFLKEERKRVEVELDYILYPDEDVIARNTRIKNISEEALFVERLDSLSLDFSYGDYDLIHFSGRYGMERLYRREPLQQGVKHIASMRGSSSHQENPFGILAGRNTTEHSGDCYGFALLYSSSFHLDVERDSYRGTRVSLGMQNDNMHYLLEAGEELQSPEAILSFGDGLSALSNQLQSMVKKYIVAKSPLSYFPILLNSWEACYFNFTGEKIIELAREGKALGMNLLVMDDGWFGKRDTDFSGLGDWVTNEEKLGMSLESLGHRLEEEGMHFGIWIEPEMVNEDSALYRAHPDYALQIPGESPIRSRSQLVLDFSRKEVVDAVLESLISCFRSVPLSYIKMDMNRSIMDVYSHGVNFQGRGKILHRYCLGLYRFLSGLKEAFPNVLIEGCSGGGGRFDLGALYYTPQIWLSDNTDAIERLEIQYGSSFLYPIQCMGAHVSQVPNHQTGRVVPMNTRAIVAMSGSFGYELDPKDCSEEDKAEIHKQIAIVEELESLMKEGSYYRLSGYGETGGYTSQSEDRVSGKRFTAWSFVSPDKKKASLSVVWRDKNFNGANEILYCKGLKREGKYRLRLLLQGGSFQDEAFVESLLERTYSGFSLMEVGLPLPEGKGEYDSFLLLMEEV